MIRLFAVGRLRSGPLTALADEYLRRIRPWAAIAVVEVRNSDPHREGTALLSAVTRKGGTAPLTVLDERGRQLSSRDFAGLLANHGSLNFVIGGPDGLDDAVRAHADHLVSLSRMTLPHELARVVLLEQIYRGLSINRGHSYHRD